MKKILQINAVVNTTSTGRIAEGIGEAAMESGWESVIAYGRYGNSSLSKTIKIGTKIDNYAHVFQTRLFDKQGLASKKATHNFLKKIVNLKPDLIHLHNLHGYYINYAILFPFLQNLNIPIVWTLHDCWPFTGHCTYYSYIDCQKWQTEKGCFACPQKKKYPASYLYDGSQQNFKLKKDLFSSARHLTMVPVSNWLKGELKRSFLGEKEAVTIHNGIDLNQFQPQRSKAVLHKYKLKDKFTIIGVASIWSKRKGLEEFLQLSKVIDSNFQIVLVGLSKKQIQTLPENIIGIERTESIEEMAALYSLADVFVNPTLEDNYPTTNMEAIACGTPVITYNTGGSPESINEGETGFIIPQGDTQQLKEKINLIQGKGKSFYKDKCRNEAEKKFDKEICFQQYVDLYEELLT